MQGNEDEVVPPNQSTLMYEALKKKGVPTALLLFQGEQHGWRKADSIRRALEGELHFYGQVFGFDAPMSPELEQLKVLNLEKNEE